MGQYRHSEPYGLGGGVSIPSSGIRLFLHSKYDVVCPEGKGLVVSIPSSGICLFQRQGARKQAFLEAAEMFQSRLAGFVYFYEVTEEVIVVEPTFQSRLAGFVYFYHVN